MPLTSQLTRLCRPLGVLLLGLTLSITGLPPLAAVAGASGAPADGAGYVDFSYGTATDDVTAHTSQSKAWYHAGSWWAVMMEPAATSPVAHEARWAIFRLDVPSQTWVSTNVQVDERNQSHPDVLAWGDQLYVVSSYSRSATEPVKVFRFDYQAASGSYALNELFVDTDPIGDGSGRADDGIETQALGVRYATIARVDDTLLIAYASANEVWSMVSTTDGVTWSSPSPLGTGSMAPIAGGPGATTSSDDVAVAVSFGGSLGIVWSRTSTTASPYGGFYLAVRTSTGFAIEPAWHGDAIGDNHVSAKAAADGSLLVAVKTSLKGADDPLVSLLRRAPGGGWTNFTVITRNAGGVSQDATRPVLVLDTTSAHVLMTDRVDGGSVYRNSANLATLAFTNGLGTAFIRSSAHPYVNDVTTTKQQVDAAQGIIALASDDTDGVDTYLHGCTGASCPAGPVAGPPAASISTTTTLTSSPNPSVSGGAVLLRATVSGGASVGGSVTFFDGAQQLKTVAVTGGTATTSTTALSTGTHELRAVYSGSSTHLPSSSGVLVHRVTAPATGGGTGGTVAPPPAGSRLHVLAKPLRLVAGKRVRGGKVVTVALPNVAELRGAALNVSVTGGRRDTRVAVCPGDVSKAACRQTTLMRVGSGERKARFQQITLTGPSIKLFNAKGKARFTVDVQGWFVMDEVRPKFTALSTAQRVVANRTVRAGTARTIKIPASMRPSGTVAVQLYVKTSRASRAGAFTACRAGAGKRACLSRPTLYPQSRSKVGNLVVVRVRADGRVKLVNSAATVRATIVLRGVVTRD